MNNSSQFRKIGMLLAAIMLITKIAVSAAFTAAISTTNTIGNCNVNSYTLDPQIMTEPENQSTCNGGMVTFTVVASGTNLTYQWKRGNTNLTDGGNISGSMSPSLTIHPATTLDAGSNYYVLVTGANGTIGSNYVSLIIGNIPSPSISGPNQFCPGTSINLNATGRYTGYSWSNGATTAMINVSLVGNYAVTVSDNAGCTSTAHKSVYAFGGAYPQILSSGLNNLCGGGSATLWVGASFSSYEWSTGASTQVITINTGGPYAVTATNSNGCTGSAMFIDNNYNCTMPSALSTTNMGGTYATANWTQPECHYDYTIGISPHNANTWTEYEFNPNSHYTFSGLSRSTTYDWHIRTNCNSTQTATSSWTAIQVFTTSAARELEDPTTNPYPATFNVYPNPANDQVNIAFSADNAGAYILNLTDMTGRIVKTEVDNAGKGDNLQVFNLKGIAKGVYILEFRMGDIYNQSRIMVE